MVVIQQMRHRCYSSPTQLHVFSSNKSACILQYVSLECYGNCKPSAVCSDEWQGTIFHPFISRNVDWGLLRIKYTNKDWRHFKHEYHSKPCALLMTSLDFTLSNTSIFADRIFEIIKNLCDRRTYKKTRNKQTITFKIYVIQQTNATLYCIKYKYK